MYGSVIFSCLGPTSIALTGGTATFVRAENFMRKMLRWAVRDVSIDTRSSFLYVMSNSTNVQVLGQKNCVRFFKSISA